MHIKNYLTHSKNESKKTNGYRTGGCWRSLGGISAEPITNTENIKKQLKAKYHKKIKNSKLRDQNINIRSNYFTQLILNITQTDWT